MRVALIGASVRAAAESAKLGGFTVIGLDQFGDQDTLSACECHLLLDEAMHRAAILASPIGNPIAQIGQEIPLIPVGGLVGARQWLDDLPLLGSWPGQRVAAEKVRDLDCLRAATKGTTFSVPDDCSAGDPADNMAQGCGRARWLRKDLDSSGGLGTRWIGGGMAVAPDEVVQKWVAGRAFGATYLSNGSDVRLLGVCRLRFTRKGAFPFVYCGSVGPVSMSQPVQQGLIEIARRISLTTGLRGLFNLDFIVDPAGPLWLLEINPRWSGSSELIERQLRRRRPEISLFSLMVDGMNGAPLSSVVGDIPAAMADDPVYFKRIVFARRAFRFDRNAIERLLRVNETLHDIPASGRLIRRGEPVCTLIRQLDGKEKDPMPRHRVLVRQLSGVASIPT